MIIGDFNVQNSMWDKHCKSSSILGVVLEYIILRHSLYVATNTGHTCNISSQDVSKFTYLTLDKYISDEKCIKATSYIASINSLV